VPFTLSIIIGMAAAGLLAIVVGYPLLRLKGPYLALGTLGFGMIVFVVLMQWQDVTGGPSGLPIPRSQLFGHTLNWRDFYYMATGLAVLTFITCQHITECYIGRAFIAIREDEEAAQTLGINVVYYKMMSFVFSAILAGLSGGIYPRANSYITPELFDVNMSIKLLIIVVIGGLGSNWGVVLGVILITILPQLLTIFEEYELLLFGLITFLVVVLLPKGLISSVSQVKILINSRRNSGDVTEAGSN
jgi:branched-chain amino acid transport system permease protein